MTSTAQRDRTTSVDRYPLYDILIGLTTLAIFLQAVWAGIFIKEGKGYDQASYQANMVTVHDWGARIAFVLALAAAVVGFLKLRQRTDLWAGALAIAVLIFIESYIGGEIGNHPGWTAMHIPLAMLLISLAVYLPLRSRMGSRRR